MRGENSEVHRVEEKERGDCVDQVQTEWSKAQHVTKAQFAIPIIIASVCKMNNGDKSVSKN